MKFKVFKVPKHIPEIVVKLKEVLNFLNKAKQVHNPI